MFYLRFDTLLYLYLIWTLPIPPYSQWFPFRLFMLYEILYRFVRCYWKPSRHCAHVLWLIHRYMRIRTSLLYVYKHMIFSCTIFIQGNYIIVERGVLCVHKSGLVEECLTGCGSSKNRILGISMVCIVRILYSAGWMLLLRSLNLTEH